MKKRNYRAVLPNSGPASSQDIRDISTVSRSLALNSVKALVNSGWSSIGRVSLSKPKYLPGDVVVGINGPEASLPAKPGSIYLRTKGLHVNVGGESFPVTGNLGDWQEILVGEINGFGEYSTSGQYYAVFMECWDAETISTGNVCVGGNFEIQESARSDFSRVHNKDTATRVSMNYLFRAVPIGDLYDGQDNPFGVNGLAPRLGSYAFSPVDEDPFLFVAGNGSDEAVNALGSATGFVYALPMFVVSRNTFSADPIFGFGHERLSRSSALKFSENNACIGTDRPDGQFFDVVYPEQVVDVRHVVSGERNIDAANAAIGLLLSGELGTTSRQTLLYTGGSRKTLPVVYSFTDVDVGILNGLVNFDPNFKNLSYLGRANGSSFGLGSVPVLKSLVKVSFTGTVSESGEVEYQTTVLPKNGNQPGDHSYTIVGSAVVSSNISAPASVAVAPLSNGMLDIHVTSSPYSGQSRYFEIFVEISYSPVDHGNSPVRGPIFYPVDYLTVEEAIGDTGRYCTSAIPGKKEVVAGGSWDSSYKSVSVGFDRNMGPYVKIVASTVGPNLRLPLSGGKLKYGSEQQSLEFKIIGMQRVDVISGSVATAVPVTSVVLNDNEVVAITGGTSVPGGIVDVAFYLYYEGTTMVCDHRYGGPFRIVRTLAAPVKTNQSGGKYLESGSFTYRGSNNIYGRVITPLALRSDNNKNVVASYREGSSILESTQFSGFGNEVSKLYDSKLPDGSYTLPVLSSAHSGYIPVLLETGLFEFDSIGVFYSTCGQQSVAFNMDSAGVLENGRKMYRVERVLDAMASGFNKYSFKDAILSAIPSMDEVLAVPDTVPATNSGANPKTTRYRVSVDHNKPMHGMDIEYPYSNFDGFQVNGQNVAVSFPGLENLGNAEKSGYVTAFYEVRSYENGRLYLMAATWDLGSLPTDYQVIESTGCTVGIYEIPGRPA